MGNLFEELKRRHVFRVAVGYAAIAWVIAQVAEFALDTFEAPAWVLQSLVIVLLCGLPVAIFLAWAYELTPQGVKRDADARQSLEESKEEPAPAITASGWRYPVFIVLLVAVGFFAYRWLGDRQPGDINALSIAAAKELVSQDRFGEAYAVLQEALENGADKADVASILDDIVIVVDPRIEDPEARISFRPYDAPEADWTVLDRSDPSTMRAPRGGVLLRVEKEGYTTRELAAANPGPMMGNMDAEILEYIDHPIPKIILYREGAVAEDMVRVPETDISIFLSGFARATEGDQRYPIPAFDVGRFEVVNRDYKSFVDDGGYENRTFWQGMQLADGSPIDDSTIASFVDTTGRPGPANWELGTYPPGEADLPVGGISLFEARAYARYRGMSLPTIHHWARVAFAPLEGVHQIAPFVARGSNFNLNGPVPAQSEIGIGPWRTVNTAGNAREWVWNTNRQYGLALGGAWTNYDDMYQVAYTIDPLDRAPQNGMRLMHTLGEPVDSKLLEPVVLNWEAMHAQREPVSDETFEAMRFQFTHVRREPATVTIETVQETDIWIAEEVTLEFVQGKTFMMYVVSPVNAPGRLQSIIYMPHSGAVDKIPNRKLLDQLQYLDYVLQAGRAVVIPVWTRMAQRYVEVPAEQQARDDLLRRVALAWYEDVATTIDYLETRADFDASRVAFMGMSYGAYRSPIILALEDRISSAVLISGGAPYWEAPHPMYDPVNYLPRVLQPVMMINGRHDHLFTYENSQLRMLELLGTPAANKKHLVFEEGHFDFPRNTVAREVSDWFDEYLGPVRGSDGATD